MTDEARQGVMLPGDGHIAAYGENIQSGANGTRLWPDEVEARIVTETYDEGATMAGAARPHGLARTQLSDWRRLARQGLLGPAADAGSDPFDRVPVTVSAPSDAAKDRAASRPRTGSRSSSPTSMR